MVTLSDLFLANPNNEMFIAEHFVFVTIDGNVATIDEHIVRGEN